MIIDETHRRRETNTYTILDKCDMHAPYHNTYALKKVKEVVSERERERHRGISICIAPPLTDHVLLTLPCLEIFIHSFYMSVSLAYSLHFFIFLPSSLDTFQGIAA